MDSILTSIKKDLGIAEEYEHYDSDIIRHINSVFMILKQLGVGPSKTFKITDKYDLWTEFLDSDDLEAVKTYMYMKVKLIFDPPTSSAALEAMKESIKEYEFRLNVAAG